ncbi:Lrp/AsnC family transcriptional regulator [Embleya sp. NPDC050154]|uniref:Lrp/AsnC family transcriptional regulator n=1 Tax=Embleya sp. NPDC050154 TaxID=3363988 RepID=UPI0037A4C4BF
MASNPRQAIDSTDVAILSLLQRDGRMSTAELAREINMSPSSTADRLRRLTDHGIINGYRAVIDQAAIGHPLTAFVRLRFGGAAKSAFLDMLRNTPQVLEAHHVTGEDCYLIRVAARSMEDLETISTRIAVFGHVTTNIVFASPIPARPLTPDLSPTTDAGNAQPE